MGSVLMSAVWFSIVKLTNYFTTISLQPIHGIVIPLMTFALRSVHLQNIRSLHGLLTREEPAEDDPILEVIRLGQNVEKSLLDGLVFFIPFVWIFKKPWRWLALCVIPRLCIPAITTYLFFHLAPIQPGLGRRSLGLLLDNWDTRCASRRDSVFSAQLSTEDAQVSVYKYTALEVPKPETPEKEIRLVQITRDSISSKLQYSLVKVTIPNKEYPYDAISYTWDGQFLDRDLDLLVGNTPKRIKTSRNVKEILADRSPSRGTTYLWIDALCINQKDEAEKNAQVSIMGTIYRSARRTLIWLDNKLAATPKQPRPLPSDLIPILILFTVCRLLKEHCSDRPKVIIGYAINLLKPYFWDRLQRFISHPYWTRVWIIQEIALANGVDIQYGGQVLNSFHIVEALQILSNPPIEGAMRGLQVALPNIPLNRAMASNSTEAVSRVFNIGVLRQFGPTKLETALELSFESHCRYPLDKVYGIRALILGEDDETSELANLTRPGRHDGYIKLYTDITKYLLNHNPNFVFERSGLGWFHLHNKALPTWVVNLPMEGSADVFKLHVRQLEVDVRRRDYCAGGVAQFAHSFHDGNDTHLRLSVLRLCTLSYLSDSWNLSGEVAPITSFLKSCLEELKAHHHETTYRPTGQRRFEAFWRTLIGDKVRETPYSEYAFPAPADWETKFQEMCSSPLVNPFSKGRTIGDALQDPPFANQFQVFCLRRRFGVMNDGYIGLVPDGAEVGDVVGIVPGIKIPLLFRECEGARNERIEGKMMQLVGSCYVHGVMNGEAVMNRVEVVREEYIVR